MKTVKKILWVLTFLSAAAFCSAAEKTSENTYDQSAMLKAAASGLKITSSYTNAFSIYNMDKYSKNAVGATLGFEYSLLPEFAPNLDLGFYGRASFQDFIPSNLQLIQLLSYGFSGGLFCQWNLNQDISMLLSAGGGFLISQLDFISMEKGSINDVYYDFMLEADFSLRAPFYKGKSVNLLFAPGCHFAFYNEKTESFCSLGPVFGFICDFKPCRNSKSSSGAKK